MIDKISVFHSDYRCFKWEAIYVSESLHKISLWEIKPFICSFQKLIIQWVPIGFLFFEFDYIELIKVKSIKTQYTDCILLKFVLFLLCEWWYTGNNTTWKHSDIKFIFS